MLQKIELNDWEKTRDALQNHAKVLSFIRLSLTPKEKHWYHLSLKVTSLGITTNSIPFDHDLRKFQLTLDLTHGECIIDLDIGESIQFSFLQLSQIDLYKKIIEHLEVLEIKLKLKSTDFSNDPQNMSLAHINTYRDILFFSDNVLKKFKAGLNEETGPVQLWPDHFDLALLWFSGSKISGTDPNDLENALEQMNFGFSTGDSSIKEAYYYITIYPMKTKLSELNFVKGAYHNTKDFEAIILPYSKVVESDNPANLLSDFLRNTFNQLKLFFT